MLQVRDPSRGDSTARNRSEPIYPRGLLGIAADSLAQEPAGWAAGDVQHEGEEQRNVTIEHPSGSLEVALRTDWRDGDVRILSGGVTRTARKIMSGTVYVPAEVGSG